MPAAHVVIVGGGFGGLDAARALAGADVRVTLLDRHNYHLFQPLLYQVATASLSPGDVASPIRWILRRQKNVEVLLAEARADLCLEPFRHLHRIQRPDRFGRPAEGLQVGPAFGAALDVTLHLIVLTPGQCAVQKR